VRSYASVAPTFWTRGSGKKLRGHPSAQIIALYLMTSPHMSMIGICSLALPTLCHETGLSEADVRAGLAKCATEDIAHWDEDAELVWVPALARYQIGEEIKIGKGGRPDAKGRGVERALALFKGHSFYQLFLERYADAYRLTHLKQGVSRGPGGGLEGASGDSGSAPRGPSGPYVPDPALGPDHDPGLDPAPELDGASEAPADDDEPTTSEPAPEPPAPTLQDRARAWVKDPFEAAHTFPNPEKWHEVLAVAANFDHVFPPPGRDPRTKKALFGWQDSRVRVIVERFAEGSDPEELCEAISGAKLDGHIQRNAQFQALSNILKSAEQVERFRRLLAAGGERPRPASSPGGRSPAPKQPNGGTWTPPVER
jgi:hypothetical protein